MSKEEPKMKEETISVSIEATPYLIRADKSLDFDVWAIRIKARFGDEKMGEGIVLEKAAVKLAGVDIFEEMVKKSCENVIRRMKELRGDEKEKKVGDST